MQGLPSRANRFDLKLPLSFRTEDELVEGRCINVSETGMLVLFEHHVELFTRGELRLLAGEYYVNINARVARHQHPDYGLAYQVATENDRLSIAVLIHFALEKAFAETINRESKDS